MQNYVNVGEFEMPVWEDEGGEVWYPISYINQKIMNRQGIKATEMKKYSEYISKKDLLFKESPFKENTCNVINRQGIELWIKGMKIGRMDDTQMNNLNELCEVLKLDYQVKTNKIVIRYNNLNLNKDDYTIYEWDCIQSHLSKLNSMNNSNFKLCTTCQRYFPMNTNYYNYHKDNKDGYNTRCKGCCGNNFMHEKDLNYQIYLMGEDKYLEFKNKDEISFMIDNNVYFKRLDTKENELRFICGAINIGRLKSFTIMDTKKYLYSVILPRESAKNSLQNSIIEILNYCQENSMFEFEGEYINQLWRFENISADQFNLNDEQRVANIRSYIKFNNVVIDDIFNYGGYHELLKESKVLSKYYRHVSIELILKLYDNKYPAYMFKNGNVNYWKSKENRIKEMIFYIENDLKVENLDKLPLYLTKGILNNSNRILYHLLPKYYSGELYNWVNECYPDRFDPKDFNIFYRRDEFDSLEEGYIHAVLKNKFGKSLFYNHGDGSQKLTLSGYQPDWVVLSEKPIIIEYFGMYVIRDHKNTMLDQYVEKSDKKMSYYDSLEHYDKIYLFPKDVRDDCSGVKDKINCY